MSLTATNVAGQCHRKCLKSCRAPKMIFETAPSAIGEVETRDERTYREPYNPISAHRVQNVRPMAPWFIERVKYSYGRAENVKPSLMCCKRL